MKPSKSDGSIPVGDEQSPPLQDLPNICPKCGAALKIFLDSGIQDTQYFYKWFCPECRTNGTEWHKLVFVEHILD